GTRNYAAPEQVSGRIADVGPRSDIYSLGMVLYESVTLRRAGQVQAPVSCLMARGLSRQRARELTAVIEKATATRPRDRYADMDLLGCDLRALLEGREVSVRPAWVGLRFARWAGRHPVVAALSIGLVTSLALGLLIALLLLNEKVAAERKTLAAHEESERR